VVARKQTVASVLDQSTWSYGGILPADDGAVDIMNGSVYRSPVVATPNDHDVRGVVGGRYRP
jgi:hypothetical protein